MRVLVILSFILAISFMIGLDLVLWMESPLYGIGGIVGMIAYFVAYSISGDMILAPRDYWRLSSWKVFQKKMGYAFSAFIIVSFQTEGIFAAILNN